MQCQGIIQEFNLGVGFQVMRTLQLAGVWRGGGLFCYISLLDSLT